MDKRTAHRTQASTFEEVARLDPDSQPGELDAGEWVPVTKNTWRHAQIAANVCAVLRDYARRNAGWSVAVGDPGTKLGRSPDILRGPDVAIVRRERVPMGKGADGWLEGAPDVAVEIVGDAQSVSDLAKKALEYLRAGAKAVWVLDPEPQRVLVFTQQNQIRVVERDATLGGEDALPGFTCTVSEFFEAWPDLDVRNRRVRPTERWLGEKAANNYFPGCVTSRG